MTTRPTTVLVIGATGSIGHLVVAEAIRQGYTTRVDPLFDALDADPPGALDGVHDTANMPLEDEPYGVRAELEALATRRDGVSS